MIKLNPYDIDLLSIDKFLKQTKFKVDKPKLKELSLRDSKKPFSLWTHTNKYYRKVQKKEKERKTKEQVYFDMFTLALGQEFEIEELYPPQEKIKENAETYLDLKLKSVIKINKKDWLWPVDILITDYPIDEFLLYFDIGICKAALEYVNMKDILKHKDTIPKTPEDLLRLAQLDFCFLKDLKNKELKLIISDGMNTTQIVNSLENHISRIEKKYHWKIVIEYMDTNFTEDFDWDNKENLEKLLEQDKRGIISMIKNYFLLRKIKNNLNDKLVKNTKQKKNKI